MQMTPRRAPWRHATNGNHRDGVLAVANYAPDVGYAWWLMEDFWHILSKAAQERGGASAIAYPVQGTIPQHIAQLDGRTLVQPIPGTTLSDLWRSLKLVYTGRIRLVYFTDRPFLDIRYALMRLAGVRQIIVHDHTPGDRPPVRGMRRWIKWFLNSLPWITADQLFCVSPLMAQRAATNQMVPSSKTTVIQNGIPTDDMPTLDAVASRDSTGSSEPLRCVTASRATAYKRVDFLLDVAEALRDRGGVDRIALLHCGDGPLLETLRREATRRSLDGIVTFLGRRSDVPALLNTATFALHPSAGEGFSLAILEYMRAGLITVVPDVPSVAQAIVHDVSGVIYPDADARAVADLLLELADDPPRRARLREKARLAVASQFSIERTHREFTRAIAEPVARALP
jgi:glycosyltransferase involved in cell wall biosynthesis